MTIDRVIRTIRRVLLVGLSIALAACGDGHAPSGGQAGDSVLTTTQRTPLPTAVDGGMFGPSGDPPAGGPITSSLPSEQDPSQSAGQSDGNLSMPAAENSPSMTDRPPDSATQIVTVRWDAPTGSQVLGYKIYVVSTSGTIDLSLLVGPVTQWKLPLPRGHKYLLTVTAYNSAGESPAPPYVEFDLS